MNTDLRIKYLLLTALFIVPVVFVLVQDGRNNPLVIFSFLLVISQSSYLLFFTQGRSMSLVKMYYTFSYAFFGFVPLLEYRFEIAYFGAKVYGDYNYLLLNSIIIICNLMYYMLYIFYRKKFMARSSARAFRFNDFENRPRSSHIASINIILIIFLALLSFGTTIYTRGFSVSALVYRGLLDQFQYSAVQNIDKIQVLLDTSVRILPAILLIYILYYFRGYRVLKIFLFILTLVGSFPLSLPRFITATIYLPLLILLLPSLSRNIRLSFAMCFGILYVFPFLNKFRWYVQGDSEFSFAIDRSFFLKGHFDSYQSFLVVVSENIVTYGYQLLGVIFFYVPRAYWPSKPIGSGAEVGSQMNFFFTNISANIYAEGFINFSYIGIFVFCWFLAFASAKLDVNFWLVRTQNSIIFSYPFYLILLGYSIFFMRGDLLAGVSYLVAILIPSFIAFFAIRR